MEEIDARTVIFWDMMPRSCEDESHNIAEPCCLQSHTLQTEEAGFF
jgi:hypothetical protein